MKTLLIYDNSGYIYVQMTGSYRVPEGGLNYLEVDEEIYKCKIIKSVDVSVTPNVPVFEDIPLTDAQKANIQTTAILKSLIQ